MVNIRRLLDEIDWSKVSPQKRAESVDIIRTDVQYYKSKSGNGEGEE